jgi:putative 4-mercaptohistidine N1-methyltranferase
MAWELAALLNGPRWFISSGMSTATSRAVSSVFSSSGSVNPYETDKLVNEYLLFHYGEPSEVLSFAAGPEHALGYAVRCVTECLDVAALPEGARALDLGCAVGRSSFELARFCSEVVGIDFSQRFVDAAETLRASGALPYKRIDEGELFTQLRAVRPSGVDPARVTFEQGDAMGLRAGLGSFDVVLMANLVDRLSDPEQCLRELKNLVSKGGQLIVTSPYTWLEEYTPKNKWLGGKDVQGASRSTLQGLTLCLEDDFALSSVRDLPFLIREHSRKYQWSVAQASLWRRL